MSIYKMLLGVTPVMAAPTVMPPNDGKFFYMDFTETEESGMHQTSVLLNPTGEPNKTVSYPLWISTGEFQMGVFTE